MPDSFDLRRYGPLKNWYVFWTEDGRSERWSTRTKDHELAKKRRKAFVQDLLSKEAEAHDPSIGTVLRTVPGREGHGSPSEKANDMALRSFFAFYGEDMRVSELTPSNHIASRSTAARSSSTSRRRSTSDGTC